MSERRQERDAGGNAVPDSGGLARPVMTDERRAMARRGEWPCKIGTVPMHVRIHGSDLRNLVPGGRIRFKDRDGAKWQHAIVRRLGEGQDPWFQADRM
jgi:hypothetical protein